jgi:hypothetical protein
MKSIFPPFFSFLENQLGLRGLWINLTIDVAIKEVLHFLFLPISVPEPQQTPDRR